MKNLKETFSITNTIKPIKIVSDYEVFEDKNLLDDLRIKIIQNL